MSMQKLTKKNKNSSKTPLPEFWLWRDLNGKINLRRMDIFILSSLCINLLYSSDNLNQGVMNHHPWTKYSLLPIFANKVLLVHSHTCLFTYYLFLIWHYRAELANCDRDYLACKLFITGSFTEIFDAFSFGYCLPFFHNIIAFFYVEMLCIFP